MSSMGHTFTHEAMLVVNGPDIQDEQYGANIHSLGYVSGEWTRNTNEKYWVVYIHEAMDLASDGCPYNLGCLPLMRPCKFG